MRNFFKYLTVVVVLPILFSCTDNFDRYNTNKYNLYNAEPSTLLPQMIEAMMYVQQNRSQFTDQMVGTLGGYFALGQRWYGMNFDTFNPSDEWGATPWNDMFEHVYPNYFKIKEYSSESGHWWAMARLVRAAAVQRIVDCYGPMPYSKVEKGHFYVAFDSAEEVYRGILEDLEYGASTLYEYSINYPAERPFANRDNLYRGDYRKWAKLANSLRLRVAMRIGDRQAFVDALNDPAGVIETSDDNALIACGAQANPYYIATISWGDLRAASSIVDYMVGYDDPRIEHYFTLSQIPGQPYVGLPIGQESLQKATSGPYSMPKFEASDRVPIFNASETAFLKAEAALKGWISDDPQTLYNRGISLSMERYGVSADVAASYAENDVLTPASHQADPSGNNYSRSSTITIAWDEAATAEQKLERIITQKWIANYPLGLEAWADYRRTGYPELQPSVADLSGESPNMRRGMRRLKYPYTERSMNTANYNAGVALLGGNDSFFTDLFWADNN